MLSKFGRKGGITSASKGQLEGRLQHLHWEGRLDGRVVLEGREKGGKKEIYKLVFNRELIQLITSEKLGRCDVPEKALEGQHPSLKPGWLIAEHPPCTIPARTP